MDILAFFDAVKDLLVSGSHIQRDALHVHVGLVIFVVVACVLRGPRRFQLAWCVVLALAVLGEVFDTAEQLLDGETPHYLNSLKDMFNTLLWPSIVFLGGRWLAGRMGLVVSDKIRHSPRTAG